MKTFTVNVTQTVEVSLNEAMFTKEFMEEFSRDFFYVNELEDHAEHIAQMAARELYNFGQHSNDFVEGYGPLKDMGITADVVSVYTEVQP
jgi:hypothetical protein